MDKPSTQKESWEEEWKDIVGYEGYYQVSTHGSVRSIDRVVKGSRRSTIRQIINIMLHPILYWEAYNRQRFPVVNLDDPEKNCKVCGYDHECKTDRNKHNYCEV